MLSMEPEAGFEPATYALRVRCSTPELPRREKGCYRHQASGVRSSGRSVPMLHSTVDGLVPVIHHCADRIRLILIACP